MYFDVSVIIPVYNGEQILKISLDSLVQQTYSRFEVVIINDGSSDDTEKVVAKYTSLLEIKYIYQENSGVAMARNKGISVATGDYVCFLDADDFYEPDFIKKMYSKISSSNADVCYCGYNIVKRKKKVKKLTSFKKRNVLEGYILGRIAVPSTGWIIRKSLIEDNGIKFPPRISWGEDFEFFCQVLSLSRKPVFVRRYLTNYNYGHSSMQLSSFSLEKIDQDFASISRLVDNNIVNTSRVIEDALLDFRLHSAITYKLITAVSQAVELGLVKMYWQKYERYLTRYTWNNGLRSIKLNMYKLRLNRMLENI